VTGDDWARLLYLGLLLLFLAGVMFGGGLRRFGQSLRQLAIWGLIFAMVVIAYGFRDVLRRELVPGAMVQVSDRVIEIGRGADGHFHAEMQVNGRPLRFIVDTGASDIVLSRQDAERVGIDPAGLTFGGQARTANGPVAIAPVRLGTVSFGDVTDTDVRASVTEGGLDGSLLGMSYLDRFARIEIEGDVMRLTR
jgi:aspartyl protease family protein